MARATVRTLIPLDRAAQILGIDPIHFNSVETSIRPPVRDCDDVWYQHPWQRSEKFSREEFALILNEAEQLVSSHLGYYPIPLWTANEEHQLTPYHITGYNNVRNSAGYPKSIKANWGYVGSVGARTKDLIEANAPTVFSDVDSDGYNELVTVTVVTTVTDREEIAVYFPGEDADDSWEIRPVDVVIGAGTATITFPKPYIVLPELWEKLARPDDPSALIVDGDDDSNFLRTVDVYRVYNDTSQQVVFYYQPTDCGDGVCDEGTFTGCAYIKDSRRAILAYQYATYTDGEWTYGCTSCYDDPYKMTISYRSGMTNPNSRYPTLRMKPELERLIVYYATTLADKEICGCDNFTSHLAYLNTDLAETSDRKSFMLTQNVMDNPFGTKRAAINLWHYVKGVRLGRTPVNRG